MGLALRTTGSGTSVDVVHGVVGCGAVLGFLCDLVGETWELC